MVPVQIFSPGNIKFSHKIKVSKWLLITRNKIELMELGTKAVFIYFMKQVKFQYVSVKSNEEENI